MHYAMLLLLVWLGGLLRWAIDVPLFSDIDVVNFGLAARHFDLLQHQPHPPGYLGYVLYLKLVAVVLADDPLLIAKWGCLAMGTVSIAVAYWTCRQLTGRVDSRSLWAAALVVVHPVLWYYGGDGQSHSSEALTLLALFGLAARWRRVLSWQHLAAFAFLCGLAGGLRPTILVSLVPIALWLTWRQPPRRWALAIATGLLGIAVWWLPTVILTGGFAMYGRASDALIGPVVQTYSLLSPDSKSWATQVNLVYAGWGALLLSMPLAAMGAARREWLVPLAASVVVSLAFYAMVFLAELGYLAGPFALSCLIPATWPARPHGLLKLRAGLVAAAFFGWFLLGPAHLPVPRIDAAINPSIAYRRSVQEMQTAYREAVCAEDEGATLLVTDYPNSTLLRATTWACPGLVAAMHHYKHALQDDLDAWVLYTPTSLLSVPTIVPWENGPPKALVLPWRFHRVVIGPHASDELRAAAAASARCSAQQRGAANHPVWVYPAACVPLIAAGAHRLMIVANQP